MFKQIVEVPDSPILKEFALDHQALMTFNPIIKLINVLQDDLNNKEYLEIELIHPLVFDLRLLPKTYRGIPVYSGYGYDFIPEDFYEGQGDERSVVLTLGKFEKFIVEHITEIRQKFNNMNLTKDEALNALTNNPKGYEWEQDIIKKPEDFFNSLHDEINGIYKKSNIFTTYSKNQWGFSISSTPLEKHKPVLVGLNWGAGEKWIEQGRQLYPHEHFNELKDLGSFGRVKDYLKEYLVEKLDVVQVNYCFFRSQNDKQIFADLNICHSQFLRLIRYLEPTKILVFSSLAHQELNPFITELKEHRETFKRGKSDITFKFYKGIINVFGFDINYYSLGHPNSKIPGEIRRRAWEFCFGSNLL